MFIIIKRLIWHAHVSNTALINVFIVWVTHSFCLNYWIAWSFRKKNFMPVYSVVYNFGCCWPSCVHLTFLQDLKNYRRGLIYIFFSERDIVRCKIRGWNIYFLYSWQHSILCMLLGDAPRRFRCWQNLYIGSIQRWGISFWGFYFHCWNWLQGNYW